MTDGRGVLSLTVFRKEKYEIDIGGKVQLSPAEFTHADHDERHRSPIRIERCTVTRDHRLHGVVDSALHGVIGERREIGERFFECGEPREIAPSNPHHFATTPETQPTLCSCLIRGRCEHDSLRPTRSTLCQA